MNSNGKREYLRAIHGRCRQASREAKHRILDEFCHVTRDHRKYAIRVLRGPRPGPARPIQRPHPATYGPAVIAALRTIWEAAGSRFWPMVSHRGDGLYPAYVPFNGLVARRAAIGAAARLTVGPSSSRARDTRCRAMNP